MSTTQHIGITEFSPGTITTAPSKRGFIHSLNWGAILGGAVAAIAVHLLLTALGVGAGLGAFSPMTDAHPVAEFGIGAAIVWTVCALIALAFGGFVAGRFSHSLHSGFVHGILVWSLTLIISLLLLTVATGMVMGGALKALGGGAKVVATGVTDAATEAAKRGSGQLGSFIDEGVQSLPVNAAPKTTTRAKREIGFAVTKLFAPGNDLTSRDNRAAAVKALVDNAEMSEADATKTVDEWTASYTRLKSELDSIKAAAVQKATEAADQAAVHVSHAAIGAFFALLLGMLVTSLSGSYGARRALLHGEFDRVIVNNPQAVVAH